MEDNKIKFGEQELSYKKGFKWYTLPYTDIIQAYLRIEEVNGRICCGVANFDMHFLMLKTNTGNLLKLEVTSRKVADEMLVEIKKKNEQIEIGYHIN